MRETPAEVVLDVDPVPNPDPPIHEGGDCFVCTVSAAMNYLYGNDAPGFDELYEVFRPDKDGRGLRNTWSGVRTVFATLNRQGWPVDHHVDFIRPQFDKRTWAHGWWQHEPTTEFARRLEAWLRSGYVAVTSCRLDAKGLFTEDLGARPHDHFFLLDGVRWATRKFDHGNGRKLEPYVHVVDSSRKRPNRFWVETRRLMRAYGVAGIQVVRREERWRKLDPPPSEECQ